MELTTGAPGRQQWEILQTKNGFIGGDRYFYIWLGSMPLLRPGPYRGCTGIPRKAYQCIPLPKGLLCLVKSLEEIPRDRSYSNQHGCTWWALPKPYNTTSWCECLWPQQTSWGGPEGQMSYSGACAHCAAPWSPMAFATE